MGRKFFAGAALVFLLTVLVRFPARWALAVLPKAVSCESPSGSLWNGSCVSIQTPVAAVGPISWSLHPWSLLLARLDVDVISTDSRATGHGRVALRGSQHIWVRNLTADLPLESGLLPLFPDGWSGTLSVDLDTVEIANGRIIALHGAIDARAVTQRSTAMPFGSFQLKFQDASNSDGMHIGLLRDTSGPLAVSGTLKLQSTGDYDLSGTAAARPSATTDLAKSLEMLGPPDAQGARPFALTGTL